MFIKLTLLQSAALLKRAEVLVSNDSGPVHLSASVGTPVVVIFRSDMPGKSARRWGPWGEGHVVIQRDNLWDITTDEVLIKLKEKLKE